MNEETTSSGAQLLWFYADASNQPVGPLPMLELQRLAAAGVIQPGTQVIENGATEWRAFSEVAPRPVLPPPPPQNAALAGKAAKRAADAQSGNRILTILALVALYPIGLVILWRSKLFTKRAKILITTIATPFALIITPVLLIAVFNVSPSKTPPQTSIPTVENEAPKTQENTQGANSTLSKQEGEYVLLQKNESESGVFSYDAEIELPKGEHALGGIAQRILNEQGAGKKYERCFVTLFLPGQIFGKGCYARVAFTPERKVEVEIFKAIKVPANDGTKETGERNRIIRAVNQSIGNRVKDLQITGRIETGQDVQIAYFFREAGQRTAAEMKASIEKDMRKTFMHIFTSGAVPREVVISATMYLPDRFGNESDVVVYQTALNAETAKKVNWRNSYLVNFGEVWETRVLHPDFGG